MQRFASVMIVLASCGGESAVEKCDDLVDDLCNRGVECLPDQGTHSECVQSAERSLPCGKAQSVLGSYDRCIEEINTDSCSVLFPKDASGNPSLALPADCKAVIQVSNRTMPGFLDEFSTAVSVASE